MSTIVCQNLFSCFESQLTETTTTLKLKVAAAAAPAALDLCKMLATDDHRDFDFGNCGSLQTITEKSRDKGNCYTKNSSFSRLSPKSLELCTENLGSETGSDIISDDGSSIFSSSPPFSPSSNSGESFELHDWKQKPKNPHHKEASSCGKIKNFPPPLTTMSGSSSLQVRRHREGGRLIIEAVKAPFRNSYLQAERSNGRLKLCFFKSSDAMEIVTSTDEEDVGEEEEEEGAEEEVGEEEGAGEEVEEEGAEEEEEDKEEEEERGGGGGECGGEMTGKEEIEEHRDEVELEKEQFDGEINKEMGKEKLQRLSRCKDGSHGSKGLCSNWKPALWVTTS